MAELLQDRVDAFAPAWWPLDRLGDGMQALAHHLQWGDPAAVALPPAPLELHADLRLATSWITWAADRLGMELEPVTSTAPQVKVLARHAGPALIPKDDRQGQMGFLVLLGARRDKVQLLGPDLQVHARRCDDLAEGLTAPFEAPVAAQVETLMARGSLPASRKAAVHAALAKETLADVTMPPWWLVRLPASSNAWSLLVKQRVPHLMVTQVLIFFVLYCTEALAWTLLGGGILDGRVEAGWLVAWMLLLVLMLPLQLGGQWLDGRFALLVSGFIKERLFAGALRADVDTLRRSGMGETLGRVIESQALESLVVGGTLTTVVAAIELVVACGVLALGSTGVTLVMVLAVWLTVALAFTSRFARSLAAWTRTRLALTQRLIEQMVGHRTRLAQERSDRRKASEDASGSQYHQCSLSMDRSALPLQVLVPSGWLLTSLAVLAVTFVASPGQTVAIAISLGGILLAQRGLAALVGGLGSLTRAGIAWQRVADLFRSGRRTPTDAAPSFADARATSHRGSNRTLLAKDLRHGQRAGMPIIDGVSLSVQSGDRILLQGLSGSGKSTLAALLAGLRTPDSGLLLVQGLDPSTVGSQWQSLVTLAPQFHENHVFTASLAFNLLMGHQWPPDEESLAQAAEVCEELGLGPLVARMPAGLHQRVGETGWQLSHGERSRLFLARALLQQSPLIILDESFAALDPSTMAQCLACVERRADALIVIAHP